MKDKVSIIIPNYNAGIYISRCIESVMNQSYKNIEVIIIDDGSTDNSWDIINKYKNKYPQIIIKYQDNMNASIARNKGIDLASGKYVLFLDSDDELCNDAIKFLVSAIEENKSDLVVGNFISIDSKGNFIRKEIITDKSINRTNPMKYAGMVPNPSNKLFKLDIIKNNRIYFGNVRIGQDLNFFLKYLVFCNHISLIDYDIYMWRKVEFSISNSMNFRIFDITESFKNLKIFYSRKHKEQLYEEYIKPIEYRHYYLQMEKQKYFKKRSQRNLVVNFFKLHMKALGIKKIELHEQYRSDYKKSVIKVKFKNLYTSKLYYYFDKNFSRRK